MNPKPPTPDVHPAHAAQCPAQQPAQRPAQHRPRFRDRLLLQEDLNFLLTNRIPRIAATRFMGWFSKLRQPLVRDLSIWLWRQCTTLDLSDASRQQFDSLHDCFTRSLRPGARPIDTDRDLLISPCDGIVGACGSVDSTPRGLQVFQAKGFPYTLADLFGSAEAAAPFVGGSYVTLRLTSAMYHRFHAPCDLTVHEVLYHSGDTWNVNPIALQRVQRLFCRNERAVLRCTTANGQALALVPVAAVLVASMRLHCIDVLLHLRWRGPHRMACRSSVRKGDEMGWFEHGSTIIVFVPAGFALAPGIASGQTVRMGQALLRCPAGSAQPGST